VRRQFALLLLAVFCGSGLLAAAPGVSYTGNFASDSDRRLFYFSLAQPGTTVLRTWSYAGGVNSAGAAVPEGGFDPTISVFDGAGKLIASNRDGGCGLVSPDRVTSFCWDSYLSLQLPAGNYLAVLTQADNLPNGPTLTQSFVYDPALCPNAASCPTDTLGNFTAAPGTAAPGFWDASPSKRTSLYAFDIIGASSSTVTSITSPATLPFAVSTTNYSFTFAAQSGAQAILTWSVVSGSTLPPGLRLNAATGGLSGLPSLPGAYTFAVQVTDGFEPSLPQQVRLQVYGPVVMTSAGLPSGVVGTPYTAPSINATGGSGTYSWSAVSLPAGLAIGPSGTISGTPSRPFSGSVVVTAIDVVTGLSASVSLGLVIVAPPVSITGNSNLGDLPVGASVAASFTASGGIPPLQWTLSGAPGLNVDNNGNVRGAASTAGTFSPTITVTDSLGTTGSQTLALAVLGITGSFPPGTTSSPYRGSATGIGGAPPYSYVASGIPAGLSFAGGALTGQPRNPGNYSIGVQVTDSKGVSVAANYTFTVTGPAPQTLTIITTSLSDGFAGQPYSQALGAGGGSPGYTWSQTGGQLPAGLSLSGGTIAGTPTATGSYAVGVKVSDASGGEAIGTVAINIQPAPLRITSSAAFPAGIIGIDYPAQILTASGGAAPYTFSIKGALPAGLSLTNGQIGGTPSATGNFGFNVVVTDSSANPVNATLNVTGVINPSAPDLVLSSVSSGFTFAAGSSAPPSPASIVVASSDVSQVLNFSATTSTPWITTGGSTSTPGNISISLNSAALALGAAGSPYSGVVTVSCTSLPCAGKSQSIAVSLTITTPPAQLSLGTPILSFVALASNPQSSSAALSIVNAGGGSLAVNSVIAVDSWLSVGAVPANVAPGPGGSVTITANPGSLKPGYYLSSVTVNSSAGNATIPVTLLISASSVMTLGPAGTQFSMPQGGALGNPNGSFLVSVSTGSVNFTASVLPGASWLTGGTTGSATPSIPGSVGFAIDPTAAATLTAGAYYGTIRVSGSGIVNSPQDFQIVLNISPPSSKVIPDPEPAGLVFISSGGALPAQNIQVFASSVTPIAYQASASPIDGSGWLSVSPATGFTSAAAPANPLVSVNAARLSAGVYRGSVSFSFGTAVRTVNVTLIVQAALPSSSPASSRPASNGLAPHDTPLCPGTQLVPTQTGLVSNFSAPASWPTPVAIQLADTCGNTINGAQIVATFSNGDPPLVLTATDSIHGVYSGTWTPRKTSAQLSVLARASAPGYSPSTVQITGQVAPNTAPVLAPNGTYDIFHPQVGAGLGPGNIVQIYGTSLANQTASPTVLPLPTEVNGTMVLIGGVKAPLYYVSPGQINAQVPFELTAGSQYQVIVGANGALTTPQPIQLTPSVPAILQFTSGAVVAQHLDGTLILDSSPAAAGENIVIYLTGLGATDIAVPSGAPSPSDPLARVLDTPVLTLNGAELPIQFAGLTPTLVGLYQINFQVPSSITTGSYELTISQDGTVSNTTILQVHQ
jgi:large repetitive protein